MISTDRDGASRARLTQGYPSSRLAEMMTDFVELAWHSGKLGSSLQLFGCQSAFPALLILGAFVRVLRVKGEPQLLKGYEQGVVVAAWLLVFVPRCLFSVIYWFSLVEKMLAFKASRAPGLVDCDAALCALRAMGHQHGS